MIRKLKYVRNGANVPLRGSNSAAAPGRVRARARSLGAQIHARIRAIFGASDGGALIEFALVLPMMMVIITGMFSFGIALNNQLELTQAVGSGAQYLQTIRTSTTDPCKDTFNAIKSAAPNLHSANITLTVTMGSTPEPGTSCSGDQTYLTEGGTVTVYATYPCNLFVYGLNLGTSCNLQAQVTEYEY